MKSVLKCFSKNREISNFIKILSVDADLFHVDGRTDGQTDRRSDGDRQTDRHTDRQTYKS